MRDRVSAFLSHNSADKPFVRKLGSDLEASGIRCWIDEAEIKVGESLIKKIQSGIEEMSYLIVVLSPESVRSPWVEREVEIALTNEISGRTVSVLPILLQDCELPGFLSIKKYADFRDPDKYTEAFADLVRSMGVAFSTAIFETKPRPGLGKLIPRLSEMGIRICSASLHRPHLTIGMSVRDFANQSGLEPNERGSFWFDNSECRALFEAEGGFISFVEVEFLATEPWSQETAFDPELLLAALSINPNELELVRSRTDYHTFQDHKRNLQIGVLCAYAGAPLSVAVSSKYYGE